MKIIDWLMEEPSENSSFESRISLIGVSFFIGFLLLSIVCLAFVLIVLAIANPFPALVIVVALAASTAVGYEIVKRYF